MISGLVTIPRSVCRSGDLPPSGCTNMVMDSTASTLNSGIVVADRTAAALSAPLPPSASDSEMAIMLKLER